mmetsp:Transcript_14547/g.22209  ORF Transcript_14547/g.22209 Transcript_14547/m.22209 type:complete len:80 (-) Transcript_14547:344-583(-)
MTPKHIRQAIQDQDNMMGNNRRTNKKDNKQRWLLSIIGSKHTKPAGDVLEWDEFRTMSMIPHSPTRNADRQRFWTRSTI